MAVAIVAIAAATVGAVFCVCLAAIKNRDMATWLVLGLTVPLIAAVAICVVPRLGVDGRRMS